MKRKMFNFVCKILKVEDGVKAPEWLLWLFFPLIKLSFFCAPIQYDFQNDIYTINGVNYAGQFFIMLGKDGLEEGTKFKILSRDNHLTVEVINN